MISLVMKKTVLIFDDDEDLLEIFTFLFQENGWAVHTRTVCDNTAETADEIAPDVILMDNWIPTIGGIEATKSLKLDERVKEIPVIYVSANNDVQSLSAQAGADAFMAKPFDLEELLVLAEQLARRN